MSVVDDKLTTASNSASCLSDCSCCRRRSESQIYRPGETGTKVALYSNYFKFQQLPEFQFQQYHVSFQPDIDIQALRKAFVYQNTKAIGGSIYDGASTLYSTKEIKDDVMKFECMNREGKAFTMTIKKTMDKISVHSREYSRLLNVILRRAMSELKLQQIRQNLFDPQNKIKLNDFGLELWPGYVTSIRQHEYDILMCCEISHKVLRQETIYDILKRCSAEAGDFKKLFSTEVIGSIVLTGYNNKTYCVDDIDWSKNASSTFPYKDRQISFVDYYKEKYNIQIKDAKQPLLVSKPKARDVRGNRNELLCLIPELCSATGLTERMKADFQLMKSLAAYTRMDPKTRVERLLNFNNRLLSTEKSIQHFTESQVKLEPQLLKINARILPQETILFGNNQSTQCKNDNVDWTNAMKLNQMFHNESLTKWGIIYPQKTEIDTQNFLKLLFEVARGMRYDMKDPKMICLNDDRVKSYTDELEQFIRRDPKFIMIILPNQSADRYAAIKRISCVNNAIPTQVIVHKTMKPKKGSMSGVKSIATKVLIQMNCKLGGCPWMVNVPIKGLMTIGFDVSHDTADRRKSYGAFIASMDLKKNVKYYSAVAAHMKGEECSGTIDLHMRNAMRVFYSTHGTLPEKILFYRDGVGEGDIEQVRKQEIGQLKITLRSIYQSFNVDLEPKFCFIIVTKRINTRFFEERSSKLENPYSGAVIDDVVTLPDRDDFYLISQSVRQGTVSPTSYNVLFNTMELTFDRLQIFTYKLCHVYYNWSGTTRVPNVLQYAQKLGVLVSQYLHQPPSQRLSESGQLFFL